MNRDMNEVNMDCCIEEYMNRLSINYNVGFIKGGGG